MKKLLAIITLVALALPALAQFVPGPRKGPALTTFPFKFNHDSGTGRLTNVTVYSNPFRVEGGRNIQLEVCWATTNADYSSNVVFFFQYSPDGSVWLNSPFAIDQTNGVSVYSGTSLTLPLPLAGSKAAYNLTNIGGPFISTANDGLNWIRLAAITNVATVTTQTFWITNLNFVQRQAL